MVKNLQGGGGGGGRGHNVKGIFKLQPNCLTNKCLNSISLFNIQFPMLLKVILFLEKEHGLTRDGEPWVIQKSNQVLGTYILPLKIKEMIYLYGWVTLIRFSLFNILVDIQV